MTDLAELRLLAEQAEWAKFRSDNEARDAWTAFKDGCDPERVLALITAAEALEPLMDAVAEWFAGDVPGALVQHHGWIAARAAVKNFTEATPEPEDGSDRDAVAREGGKA